MQCALFLIFVLFYAFLCCSMYCLFCVVLCIVCVCMCTVLLPPGGYPIALTIYHIISYQILSSVVYLAQPYLSTLSYKWDDFRKKNGIEHKMHVWISLQHLSENFLVLRTERDMVKNVYRYSCKVPVILDGF